MSEWGGDVVNESHKLSDAQVNRLLKMTEVLRVWSSIETVAQIKYAIAKNDDEQALALWSDFTEDEQVALWIAPTYGGIFTTEERKRLRPTTTEETV
jgi:hypothetical protein